MANEASLPRQNSQVLDGASFTPPWYNFWRRLDNRVSAVENAPPGTGGGNSVTNIYGFDGLEKTVQDASTARTLTADDNLVNIEFTSASAVTVTVNKDALPENSITYLTQGGAGQVTVVAGTGVTIDYSDSLKTRTQESMIGLKQIQVNKYELFGDAEPVAPARSALIRSANSVGAPAFVSPTADGQVLKRSSGTLVFGALTAAETTFTPYSTLAATTVQGAIQELLDEGTAVDLTDVPTDVKLTTVGTGLYLPEGTNATMGVATLVAGSKVVSTTKVTANSRIFTSIQSLGTVSAPKAIGVTARTAGTSFTLTSADNTDTSVLAWMIVEPAAVYPSALLHFNGTDASTTFTDESGKTWTAAGNAQLDTAQQKFGTASGLFDGTGDYISTASHADLNILSGGDYTLEAFIRLNAAPSTIYGAVIIGLDSSGGSSGVILRVQQSSTGVQLVYPGLGAATLTTTISNNTWYHIAAYRIGTQHYISVDGAVTSVSLSNRTTDAGSGARIGASLQTGSEGYLNGWIDEARISKGVSRYTATTFTPTATEFTYP